MLWNRCKDERNDKRNIRKIRWYRRNKTNERDKLNKNEEYLSLIDTFLKNKKNYIKDNKLDDEILNLRKKLFNIYELKEFLKIQNNLRLLSININNIILSVLD